MMIKNGNHKGISIKKNVDIASAIVRPEGSCGITVTARLAINTAMVKNISRNNKSAHPFFSFRVSSTLFCGLSNISRSFMSSAVLICCFCPIVCISCLYLSLIFFRLWITGLSNRSVKIFLSSSYISHSPYPDTPITKQRSPISGRLFTIAYISQL